jgi:hypothetical protein
MQRPSIATRTEEVKNRIRPATMRRSKSIGSSRIWPDCVEGEIALQVWQRPMCSPVVRIRLLPSSRASPTGGQDVAGERCCQIVRLDLYDLSGR